MIETCDIPKFYDSDMILRYEYPHLLIMSLVIRERIPLPYCLGILTKLFHVGRLHLKNCHIVDNLRFQLFSFSFFNFWFLITKFENLKYAFDEK